MKLSMIRNIILIIGWPILIAGSIYLFITGKSVYRLIKGSLVGKITKALVYTMLVEMYSLGIVCTAYMFSNERSAYLVLPIFGAWFVVFLWTMKTLVNAQKEAKKLTGESN